VRGEKTRIFNMKMVFSLPCSSSWMSRSSTRSRSFSEPGWPLSPDGSGNAIPSTTPTPCYCGAFVRYCYKEAGEDFMAQEVGISNTTPEHIARAGIEAGVLMMYGGQRPRPRRGL
jgi:hypothetical protein